MINKLNKIFFLIISSILNPKKFFSVLYKKIFSIPELNSLSKIKNEYIRKKYFNFLINLSKKNLQFKKLFFEDKKNIQCDIFFNLNNGWDQDFIRSLSNNGVIVIDNVLPENEKKKIQSYFLELEKADNQKKTFDKKWLIKPITTSTLTKKRIVSKTDFTEFPNLQKLNDFFSKQIFGQKLDSEPEFFVDKSLSIPEEIIPGDNTIHIDRYLPNVKMIYSPFLIDNKSAPFSYILGSHKINETYKEMILNNKFKDLDNLTFLDKKNKQKIFTLKENSLIIFLANGFHGRTPFFDLGKRMVLFLQYSKAFNLLSYFNYRKFNN